MLNKCLDRYEQPGENVQPASDPTHSTTPNLRQSSLSSVSEQTSYFPSSVEMSPRLHEPHFSETRLPQIFSQLPDYSDYHTPTIGTPLVEERTLPIRPRLVIPRGSSVSSSNILITDDNPINRKVSTQLLVC